MKPARQPASQPAAYLVKVEGYGAGGLVADADDVPGGRSHLRAAAAAPARRAAAPQQAVALQQYVLH